MESQLILTREQVEKNNTHIEKLRDTNRYLQRVLYSDASLEGEVKDLFYFEQKGSRWRKFIPFCSNLRENHDARAKELTDILNGMDLMSVDERRCGDNTDWLYFNGGLKIELESKEIGTPDDPENYAIRGGGYFCTTMGIWITSAGISGLFTSVNLGESIVPLIAGTIFGGGGALMLYDTTTPTNYTISLKKAQRADLFLNGDYEIRNMASS